MEEKEKISDVKLIISLFQIRENFIKHSFKKRND